MFLEGVTWQCLETHPCLSLLLCIIPWDSTILLISPSYPIIAKEPQGSHALSNLKSSSRVPQTIVSAANSLYKLGQAAQFLWALVALVFLCPSVSMSFSSSSFPYPSLYPFFLFDLPSFSFGDSVSPCIPGWSPTWDPCAFFFWLQEVNACATMLNTDLIFLSLTLTDFSVAFWNCLNMFVWIDLNMWFI